MKQIIVIIQPDRLNDLREYLIDIGVCGLTVTRAFGRGGGHGFCLRDFISSAKENKLMEMSRLEILADDDQVDRLIECILTTLKKSANPDNGKIFVCDPQYIVRIRTGEIDSFAIK